MTSGAVEEVAARLKSVLDPMFDRAIGEIGLSEVLRQQVELQREYGARAARELVLVSKQLMYFERYARSLLPPTTWPGTCSWCRTSSPRTWPGSWPSGASRSPTARSRWCATAQRAAAIAPGSGRACTTTSSWTARVRAT